MSDWRAWVSEPPFAEDLIGYPAGGVSYPQPLVSDITVDGDDLIIGIMDIWGHQMGSNAFYSRDGGTNVYRLDQPISSGDTLRAVSNGAGFTFPTDGEDFFYTGEVIDCRRQLRCISKRWPIDYVDGTETGRCRLSGTGRGNKDASVAIDSETERTKVLVTTGRTERGSGDVGSHHAASVGAAISVDRNLHELLLAEVDNVQGVAVLRDCHVTKATTANVVKRFEVFYPKILSLIHI